MRLLGFNLSQAYQRRRGGRLTTFRGMSAFDYDTHTEPQGLQIPVVLACLNRISNTIAYLPRQVRDARTNQVVASPPLWVESPNSYQGGSDYIKSLVASLLLWGEAFIVPFKSGRGETQAAAVVNPQYVFHYVQGDRVVWLVNGQPFEGEMLHLRNTVLPARIRGYAAEATMRGMTKTGVWAQRAMFVIAERGGLFQLAIESPEDMDDDTMDQMSDRFMARHSGPENAMDPVFLVGGAKATVIDNVNGDTSVLNLSDMNDKQIANYWFNIDDSIMGFKSNQPQIYQNQPGVWYKYYHFACRHLVKEIERANSLLLGRNLSYDLDQSEILLGGPHDRGRMAESMAKVNQTMGVKVFTEDELREITGKYPLEVYEKMGASGEGPADDADEGGDDGMMAALALAGLNGNGGENE